MDAGSPPIALTVAAHDPLGGSGLAADLTTFAAFGVHGTLALTAVTAQRFGAVDRVVPVERELLDQQLDGLVASLRVGAVKTGLLGSTHAVEAVGARVAAGELPAPVVDPVLVDGRGDPLVAREVERVYRDDLFPLARVLTPNLREASVLVGRPLTTVEEVLDVAPELAELGSELVVVTGGAGVGERAVDVVIDRAGGTRLLDGPRISTRHTRGSGCTFAAAVTAGLALGHSPSVSVDGAKAFVAERLAASIWPGLDAVGPVAHWHD